MVSGSADNEMKLWDVATGKCLYTWEFPTAVKRVAFNDDDEQVVCITEQRMGHQGAIRVFDINRADGTKRTWSSLAWLLPPIFLHLNPPKLEVADPSSQKAKSLYTCFIRPAPRLPFAHSRPSRES